jgi:hypothetical protein
MSLSGKMAEDELFDLPRGRAAFKRTRNVGSFDRMSVDRWVVAWTKFVFTRKSKKLSWE